jgi:hypothetical protein
VRLCDVFLSVGGMIDEWMKVWRWRHCGDFSLLKIVNVPL